MEKLSTDQQLYNTVLQFLKNAHKKKGANTKDWNELKKELKQIAPHSNHLLAIHLWIMENIELHNPLEIAPRILHEFESFFISPTSPGLFLEALHYGMISSRQGESIIDEFINPEELGKLPEIVQKSITQTWKGNTLIYRQARLN